MKCFMCKGNMTDKYTNFMVDIDNCIVIVKNVPSQVCSQCGEVSYSNEIAKRLEDIVNQCRTSITEITVVHFSLDAA